MRFIQQEDRPRRLRLVLIGLFLIAVLVVFLNGVGRLDEDSHRRQRESLETALNRGVTYCYAVEGRYPESLSYLKEHYGLLYDESVFYVDYQIQGQNLWPEIVIIEK